MARKWWTLLTVCLGVLMLLLDVTIVNVALPSIARDLGSSFSDLQWTIDAYAVSLAALLLVSGSLGDLLGGRRVFVAGMAIFSASSLLGGLAPDPLFLNVCRAAQGVGGAAMFATSLALIGKEFRGRDRGTALGIWGATAGAAVALGPLIGGALTSGISWRWVFFVNLPIGALTIALLLAKVRETERRRVRPDWPGALALSGSLFALVFAVIRGNPDGWMSTKVLIALVTGSVLLALFVAIEARRRDPMLELGLLRKPAIVGVTLGSIALSASLVSTFLYQSLYLQNVLGYSAFQAGLRFLPATLVVLVVAPIAGRLTTRVPVRLLLGGGLAILALGLVLMTGVRASSGWTALLVGFMIVGVGNGIAQPARGAAALGTVPADKAGVASGLNNTALQVGIAAGIAGLGAIFQSRVTSVLAPQLSHIAPQLGGGRAHALAASMSSGSPSRPLSTLPANLRHTVSEELRSAFVSGFDRVLWVAAAIALAGGVLALLLIRRSDFEAAERKAPPNHTGRRWSVSAVAGRRAKFVVAAVFILICGAAASFSGKFEGSQKNETSSWLPGKAESVKALDAVKKYPGGELAPAVIVYERSGRLTLADRRRIAATYERLNEDRTRLVLPAERPIFARGGASAIIVQPVHADNRHDDAFRDAVQSVRDRIGESSGGLDVKLTGAAGYSLDAIKVFSSIDGKLLLVAAAVVLVLLIAIYRSPIFWIMPFFTVLLAEAAARGVGYLMAEAGVTINGQSGGILPVLVFGAGTDYALLLASRYREELRRHEDKHDAMLIALRRAGPAIVASGLTVIAALLTLSVAEVNATAGLGPVGAMGIALAMISMLTMLPALLTICGRRWFWPRVPHARETGTDETRGIWRRVGDRAAHRPRAVWVTGGLLLVLLAANVLNLRTGLTSGNTFRGDVDSVQGQKILARNFPAGASAPTDVIVPDRASAPAVARALAAQRRIVGHVQPPQTGPPGVRIPVILRVDPYSTTAFDEVPDLRRVVKRAGGESALVGGPSAQEYDLRKSAARDDRVIIPLTLLVVLVILTLLLRALVAPLLLVLSVILSFGAALGVGVFASDDIFGFPGLDPSLPLLCFVFLVALGIDYNIFLMARVREEAQRVGTREGTLRGLAVTGAVITGAGLVLAGTFGALAVLPLVSLTEIGFIVAFGVLLDTFIVRSVIVPALVIDAGRRVWWPSRLSRPRAATCSPR